MPEQVAADALDLAVQWSQIVGPLLTLVAILYAARQLRLSGDQAKASFMLDIYQMMGRHDPLHRWMLDDSWPSGPGGPQSQEEWMAVGSLLGLFDHLGYLVRDGLLKERDVIDLYSYRLVRLLHNARIRERHFNDRIALNWPGVHHLLSRIRSSDRYRELQRTIQGAIARQST